MAEPPRTESIDRALQLLVALADAGPSGAALAELAEATGINKSTAYRALATLRANDFATQSATSGHYRLGPAALALGDRMQSPSHLAEQLQPAMVALSRTTGELVHLGIWTEDRVQYVAKIEPPRPIRVWSAVGQSAPLATTSMGRALLAARPLADAQLAAYLGSLPDGHPLTARRLTEVVHEARRLGHATELGENEPGIACVGLALLRDGRPVAAMSVTAMADHVAEVGTNALARTMRETVAPLLPDGIELAAPQP